MGYDIHRLVDGGRLVLGGVEIQHPKGLLGHSDGDVLLHAVSDSILGAAALGDIGKYFPPGEPQWKGVSSLVILEKTKELITEKGWRVLNLDATIVAEQPKLAGYFQLMKERIAAVLGTDSDCISIKAKTNEGIGGEGKEEAIAAYAVALVGPVPGNQTS